MLQATRVLARRPAARGFTLIELLIVIALLLFLLTLTMIVFGGLFTRAQATRTIQAISVTMDALERFRHAYPVRNLPDGPERGFPVKRNWPDRGSVNVSEMTDGEWLRLLLFPSEEELDGYLSEFGVAQRVVDRAVIERFLNEDMIVVPLTEQADREIERNRAIVDGWRRPLYYRFPGGAHVTQTNSRGMNGRNNFLLGLPDIWSAGADGTSEYGSYGGESLPGHVYEGWASRVNDPTRSGDPEVIDDIANWFEVSSY